MAALDILHKLEMDVDAARGCCRDFIREQVGLAGVQRLVVGLSGGIDSALVAYLAADALGRENVMALRMPYRTSDPASLRDAQLVIDALGIASRTIDITPMVEPFFVEGISPARKGNIMARTRMIALYDQSAVTGGLVIGTSNRTEYLLGYGTLYGDMACAFNPIGDLYKTQIRQLARAMRVPEPILIKAPTADLWEGQTDEGEIGFTYEEVDQVLYLQFDEGLDDQQIVQAGFRPDLVRHVTAMHAASTFKRRLPPIAQIARTIR